MDQHPHNSFKDSASGCTKRSADELDENDDHTTNPKKPCFGSQDDDDQHIFDKVPEEVKCLIFQHLTFKDLISATLVCKSWSDTIDSNKELTEKILFKLPNVKSPKQNVTPIKRRYVNIKVDKLPKTKDFDYEQKLMNIVKINRFVKSIVLRVRDGDSYSEVCDFLEQFVNLRSLDIIENDSKENCLAAPDNTYRAMNLSCLESLTIRADNHRFIRIVLHATWNNVQLKTFKLTTGYNDCNDHAERVSLRLSKTLTSFLNSQNKLKVLEMSNFSPLLSPSSAQELNLQFKLTNLTLSRSALVPSVNNIENNAPNRFAVMRKILLSCQDTCETLSFTEVLSDCNVSLIECLVKFSKLKNLRIDFNYQNNHVDNEPSFQSLLSTQTMECQLQKLCIDGYGSKRFSDVRALLKDQKDSLETLILNFRMYSDSNLWSYIARETKVKTLCARLTKTAMLKMRGNSLENLINIGYPLRKDDEVFWRRFRERNPSFKSVIE